MLSSICLLKLLLSFLSYHNHFCYITIKHTNIVWTPEYAAFFFFKGYMVVPNCGSGECVLEGNSLDISFRMRTNLHTGNLLLVHGGTGVYIAAFLQNGGLNFTFSNGVVMTTVTFNDHTTNLCDGQWHSITFLKVSKATIVFKALLISCGTLSGI